MSKPAPKTGVPVEEICFPNIDDNLTLPSEISALLSFPNIEPMNYDVNGNRPYGCSHRISQPTRTTGPTGWSDGTQTTIISRKAFQLASLFACLSLGILLFADVLANMHTTVENGFAAVVDTDDEWDNSDWRIGGVRVQSEGPPDDTRDSCLKFWQEKKFHEKSPKSNKISKGSTNDDVIILYRADNNSVRSSVEDGEVIHFNTMRTEDDDMMAYIIPREETHREPQLTPSDVIDSATDIGVSSMEIPAAQLRCQYVIQTFDDENVGVEKDFLRQKFIAQSVNHNVFYRATAPLFWKDFGAGRWGEEQQKSVNLGKLVLLDEAKYQDGTPLSPMSTWTWITGDQHLMNFGAWRNRAGEVVFSVTDFDEAAVFDFHLDVLRIAVSICNHGFTNGLSVKRIGQALDTFTRTYAETVISYVGGDSALLYELTPNTSTGMLRDFLVDVKNRKSLDRQLEKFTEIGKDGVRRFIFNHDSRLVHVPRQLENKIRQEMTSTKYGASMMKMGWRVRGWDDDYFTVLDVARRVGSGIGSYGVDRFYILLQGKDKSLNEEGDSVILDVKFEPHAAVSRILDENAKAWYSHMFRNEADRAAQAQRRLTSYTDPFTGWIQIDGNPYHVRQRSPWKASFELDALRDHQSFVDFIQQIAVATATSHVRGSVSTSPGQFKHVIKVLLAKDHHRKRWGSEPSNS